jgi:hypothetical protein
MVSNNPQQNLHPFHVVLLAYKFFNVADSAAIEKEGLIRTMIASNCPRREVAEQILKRMTEEGLLKKHIDSKGAESYSSTSEGIRRTP